jgi:hypothetical protein
MLDRLGHTGQAWFDLFEDIRVLESAALDTMRQSSK